MNSLTHLREAVDVVIGVDTHVHTHCAAVVDAATGGVLEEITVEATAEGYAELVEFADNHAILRAWAMPISTRSRIMDSTSRPTYPTSVNLDASILRKGD